jgi:hypothetical protein
MITNLDDYEKNKNKNWPTLITTNVALRQSKTT